jgi:peptide/nickel transport system permease protein
MEEELKKDLEVEKELEEKIYALGYWQLVWMKFRRNSAALIGGVVLIVFYITMVIFPEFFSPYHLEHIFLDYINAPPQKIHFIDERGAFHIRPFVYGLQGGIDPNTFRRTYMEDRSKVYPIHFFVRGDPYKLFGLFDTNLHFFGASNGGNVFLFGTDRQGRDLLSRIIYGGRISLTVGLVGVFLSMILGTVLGTISGYYGGTVDNIIQRIVEFLTAFPAIPLWMALAAALPQDWPSVKSYFAITIILSIIGWGGLARQIRGKILALREEEYILAARIVGCNEMKILFTHLLPNCLSHIIVIATLSIPGMILGETSLSFLGLGIKPPMTSWGVLLSECQNVRSVVQTPWLIIPVAFVIITVLAFNFLGDGLRDAADPYAR